MATTLTRYIRNGSSSICIGPLNRIGGHKRVTGRIRHGAVHPEQVVHVAAMRKPYIGDWALLLVNKDRDNPRIGIAFAGAGGRIGFFAGEVDMVTFGSEPYCWHSEGEQSHAEPDKPPVTSTMRQCPRQAGSPGVTLPKCCITVLRGKVQGLE